MDKTVLKLVKAKLHGELVAMLSFLRGKKSNGKDNELTVGTVVISVVLVAAFALVMIFAFGLAMLMGFQMRLKDCLWLYFPLGMISSMMFALVGSIFAAQSYLFDSKDNDLLLSMPIKPSAVLLSRMLSLFLLNAVYSFLFYIPIGIAYGRFFHFTAETLIYYLVSLISIPACTTALSCIFGYFLGKISSRIPNKNLLTVVFGFVMIFLFITVGLNLGPLVSLLMEQIEVVADIIRNSFVLLYWYGVATDSGGLLYFLPLFAIFMAMPIVVYLFLSTKFMRMITHKAIHKKKKYVERPMKKTNLQYALIKKEVGYFLSIPGYVMNAGMSTVMALLLGITIILKGEQLVNWLPLMFPDAQSNLVALMIGSSLAMCCTMNDVTAPSISLEGKTLWILKSTPIKPMTIFVGKAVLSPIVSLPGVIFTAIVSAIFLNLNSLDVFFIILTPILACLFSGFLGVCINLKIPRFDWSAEITVIKQSLSVIITLLVSMLLTSIPFVFAIIPAAYLDYFSAVWSYGLCIGYFILLIGLEIFYLMTDGKKIFNSL